MRSAELYAQVIARPDDDGNVKVWADSLLEEGDPRGEFVVLQLAHEMGQLDAAGEARMNALQETHGKAWLPGQVRRLAERALFRRGRAVEVWLGQHADSSLVAADWQGITSVGFLDGEQVVKEQPEFVEALLALKPRGVKGVSASVLPLLHGHVEELSVHGAALDEVVLDQLGAKLLSLRTLHVLGAQRPVLGHLVCGSELGQRVEQLVIDFNTFEVSWREKQVRVHVFVEDVPLLRIEAELRAGPKAERMSVAPTLRTKAFAELAQRLGARLL